ncbi:SUMF1/EgtB/PvdO family nonheme iron enzyme [Salinispira pacifica]
MKRPIVGHGNHRLRIIGVLLAAALVSATGCSSSPSPGGGPPGSPGAPSQGPSGQAGEAGASGGGNGAAAGSGGASPAPSTSTAELRLTIPASDITVTALPLTVAAEVVSGGRPGMQIALWAPGRATTDPPAFEEVSNTLSTTLDPTGLQDGETYQLRVRAAFVATSGNSYGPWTNPAGVTLKLDLPVPQPDLPPQGGVSIVPSPTVTWSYAGTADAYDLELSAAGGIISSERVTSARFKVGTALSQGSYRYRVRARDSSGIWTQWSRYASFTVDPQATPVPTTLKEGDRSVDLRPALGWRPLLGADSYVVEVAQSADFGGPLVVRASVTDGSTYRLPEPLTRGDRYYYRIRAVVGDSGDRPWSAPVSFTADTIGLQSAPVVAPGKPVEFEMGDTAAGFDAVPVHKVRLTVPFEMSVYELTNAQAAAVLNWAIGHGYAEIGQGGVYTSYTVAGTTSPLKQEALAARTPDAGGPAASGPVEAPVASTPGALVVGFGNLDYGEQFGLRTAAGKIEAVPGRETQPVIGVTWDGALLVANSLSMLYGLPVCYDLADRSWNRGTTGFRLPTEAEWEYSMRGTDGRPFSWGRTAAGNVANYFRSYDPYESVNPPYTANGGPLTPVGFFDGSVKRGFATRSNASPFGVYDLCGNVWEWCWDRYASDTYAEDAGGVTNPSGPLQQPTGAVERVARGGAWNVPVDFFRGTNRGHYPVDGTSYSTGVRLVRTTGAAAQ